MKQSAGCFLFATTNFSSFVRYPSLRLLDHLECFEHFFAFANAVKLELFCFYFIAVVHFVLLVLTYLEQAPGQFQNHSLLGVE